MHTFLAYPDFIESAGVLDPVLLRTQCKNVVSILNVIHQIDDPSSLTEVGTIHNWVAWKDHPAVRMWRNCEVSLCEYGLVLCEENKARGANLDYIETSITTHMDWAVSGDYNMEKPKWFGNMVLHYSHQSNLVRYNPEIYAVKFPKIDVDLAYYWPKSSADA